MEAIDLDNFKEKLLAKRRELVEVVHKTEDYGREADSDAQTMDIADKASSSYTKEFMFSKSNADRRMLQLIAEALSRIEDGSFGTCAHCEEVIGLKRLEAVPWAGLCIRCQEREERK